MAASTAAQSISLTPPALSSGANPLSAVMAPSYVGVGIEPTNLIAFSGAGQRNNLTYNLLNNLASYTGVPPHIRIGGNAGDTMLYQASRAGYNVLANSGGSSSGGNAYSFGPDYFRAFDNFPANTPITYGLNLAYQGSDWLSEIASQANASLSIPQNVQVVSLEIGNEPDLFLENGYRSSYSVTQFGREWESAAVYIYNNVLEPMGIGTNFFEVACTATTATSTGQPYRINNLLGTAVATQSGIYIAGWNQHDYFYYIDVSTYTLTSEILLDLSSTTEQFAEWLSQSQQAYATGKPYYLREMGSCGPTGIAGISDTFANTLWTFNFFLYAATIQVASVQMHMTTLSYASPWQPVELNQTAAHVRSSYYAYAAVAQLIGATCDIRIAQLSLSGVPSGYSDHLASYNTYKNGSLQSLVAINTEPTYVGGSPGSVSFQYSVPSWAGQTVYISTLTAPGIDATAGTTWNGMSYEASGTGTSTTAGNNTIVQTTVASDGSLSVSVRDASAVVINLGSQLGTENNVVDTDNCNALAGSSSIGGDADPSATLGGTTAAPTFSSVTTDGNNPFYGAAGSLLVPSSLVLTLVSVLTGAAAVLVGRV